VTTTYLFWPTRNIAKTSKEKHKIEEMKLLIRVRKEEG
jgi:hypothetical protein